MKELGIIFLHHAVGPTTSNNLEFLRRLNPHAEIVTISQSRHGFEGGWATRRLFAGGWMNYKPKLNEYGWRSLVTKGRAHSERVFAWRNADLPIYMWYSLKKEKAKRWVIAEWDTLCLEPAESFFRPVWDADVAGVFVHRPGDPIRWPHFERGGLESLPAEYRELACGISPLAGLLFSDRALQRIARLVEQDVRFRNVFCELRVGTAACACSYDPVEMPAQMQFSLSDVAEFRAEGLQDHRHGWWHKVKDHHSLLVEAGSVGPDLIPSGCH